ncbi:MAG TPA: hypothetical protein VHU80_16270 [Polyangiaceae bacterium]|nr:hypothetical protein [Polyangiaceae bacterium]
MSSGSIAACDDGRWGYYGYGYGARNPYICSQYTSCGSCTPVQGCGWCSFDGGGACVSSPDDCGGVSQFTWSWDPAGCNAAGAGPRDAAAPPDAASASDAGHPVAPNPADAATSDDARAGDAASDARNDH